jgi:hypothetical protein
MFPLSLFQDLTNDRRMLRMRLLCEIVHRAEERRVLGVVSKHHWTSLGQASRSSLFGKDKM